MTEPTINFMVILNKSTDEILATAERYPGVYIWPFVTGPLDKVADYTVLSHSANAHRIAMPFYVRQSDDPHAFINEYMKHQISLGGRWAEVQL